MTRKKSKIFTKADVDANLDYQILRLIQDDSVGLLDLIDQYYENYREISHEVDDKLIEKISKSSHADQIKVLKKLGAHIHDQEKVRYTVSVDGKKTDEGVYTPGLSSSTSDKFIKLIRNLPSEYQDQLNGSYWAELVKKYVDMANQLKQISSTYSTLFKSISQSKPAIESLNKIVAEQNKALKNLNLYPALKQQKLLLQDVFNINSNVKFPTISYSPSPVEILKKGDDLTFYSGTTQVQSQYENTAVLDHIKTLGTKVDELKEIQIQSREEIKSKVEFSQELILTAINSGLLFSEESMEADEKLLEYLESESAIDDDLRKNLTIAISERFFLRYILKKDDSSFTSKIKTLFKRTYNSAREAAWISSLTRMALKIGLISL